MMDLSGAPIRVRPAYFSDLDALVRLGLGIQRLHADGRPDLFVEPSSEALQDFFRARFSDGSHMLIAESNSNSPIGYLLAEHATRDANPFKTASSVLYIHHIAVESSAQSGGVGRELMKGAVTLASELGVSTLRLDSWHFNTQAHGFFETEGFTPVNIVFEKLLM
ncbi:GNAT family N-acetyltransferase [Cryobacterium melibiosiphilum]